MYSQKSFSKLMLLLGRDNFLTGGGPNFLHGGNIDYGDSYLDSVFLYSKVIRLHAILHDAVGAVRLQTSKGRGYCHKIGRGPTCCLLGDVTGLLLCLYVKTLLRSFFNLFDF